MMEPPRGLPGRGAGPIEKKRLSRLLQLGLVRPKGDVEKLIERLSLPDGGEWFRSVVESGFLASWGDPKRTFLEGGATVEMLSSIKDESKKAFSRPGDPDRSMAAIAGYLFSVAAALVRHGVLISSLPREEVDSILLDLAVAAPAPWGDFLGQAALTPQGSASQGEDRS